MNEHEIAFAQLTDEQIRALRLRGTEQDTAAEEILVSEGDASYPFPVVLSGSVEILTAFPDRICTVTVHRADEFVGDADLRGGRASLITARVSRRDLYSPFRLEISGASLRSFQK